MDDLISRNAALQTVGALTWAGARISKLPSVQPEPKKGKWIKREGLFQCSACELFFVVPTPFCPNCGADLREEEN